MNCDDHEKAINAILKKQEQFDKLLDDMFLEILSLAKRVNRLER